MTGPTGAAGTAGAAGQIGATGAAGPQGQGFIFVGAWSASSANAYQVGDVVSYQGSSWIAVALGSLGQAPGSNNASWSLLAQEGAQGLAGATGPSGATGATGSAGVNGAAGVAGATGPTGANGIAGTNGAPGLNGAAGATGAAGSPGTAGAQGTAGLNGATAAAGPIGPAGNAGATGAVGANGSTGATGAAGASGAAGATGASGVAGATGATGATGNAGPTGANGASGTAGLAGTNGSNGATGQTGPTGPTGPSGATGVSTGWLFSGNNLYATVNGNVAIGTQTPAASAVLDLTSTTQAFLPPRMTSAQRDAIPAGNLVAGMVVFNTTTATLNQYNGTVWQPSTAGGNYIKLVLGTSVSGPVNGSVLSFTTLRAARGLTQQGNGVLLKANHSYRLEAALNQQGCTGNQYLGYAFYTGSSQFGDTAYTPGPDPGGGFSFGARLLEFYTPSVDTIVTVIVTDASCGPSSVITPSYNSYLVATEI